ncbi:MAG: glycosyltransferase family 4 protein [Proteobacteria bacterium]|nr:glycosyltransferase family 4 protein [Pseudomonadota bacterium]
MTVRALTDLGADVKLVSYLDRGPLDVFGIPVTCAGGGKVRFAALCQVKGAACDHFIYDSAGIARAHPKLIAGQRGYSVWMHGIEAWEKLRPEHGAVLTAARRVLVNSNFTLRRFEDLHGRLPQGRVCWLGTEDDSPSVPREPHGGAPSVLSLSRIDVEDSYKGQGELIAAWPEVRAAVPGAKLIVAGDGTGRAALEAQAHSLGLGAAVEFCGFVPEAELPKLWARADVFAMPSREEGFGLVYVEAMRQGLPVVASVHDAGSEVNVEGETGFNVDLGLKGMLAARLITLLNDRDLRCRFGAAGQRRWREEFCYSRFRSRLKSILPTKHQG